MIINVTHSCDGCGTLFLDGLSLQIDPREGSEWRVCPRCVAEDDDIFNCDWCARVEIEENQQFTTGSNARICAKCADETPDDGLVSASEPEQAPGQVPGRSGEMYDLDPTLALERYLRSAVFCCKAKAAWYLDRGDRDRCAEYTLRGQELTRLFTEYFPGRYP